MNKPSPVPSVNFIFEKVELEVAEDIVAWIIEANLAKNKHSFLNLIINSEGGDLAAMFAIIDMMDSSMIPIRTVGTGQLCSAGLMIFLNGEKGKRLITPNTSIMSHRFSAGSDGKFHELKAIEKEFDLVNTRMFELYAKTTGLDKRKIEKYLLSSTDIYLSPEEALKHGVCDSIGLVNFQS